MSTDVGEFLLTEIALAELQMPLRLAMIFICFGDKILKCVCTGLRTRKLSRTFEMRFFTRNYHTDRCYENYSVNMLS